MKHKLTRLCLLMAICSITFSCASKQDKLKPITLTDEAGAEAQKFWDNFSARCGDSTYVSKPNYQADDYIYEFKTFKAYADEFVLPPPLTEADRLNRQEQKYEKMLERENIEWQGNIRLIVGASREYSYKNKQWSRWEDDPYVAIDKTIGLSKIAGRWKAYDNTNGQGSDYMEWMQKIHPKVDCSQIPR